MAREYEPGAGAHRVSPTPLLVIAADRNYMTLVRHRDRFLVFSFLAGTGSHRGFCIGRKRFVSAYAIYLKVVLHVGSLMIELTTPQNRKYRLGVPMLLVELTALLWLASWLM